MQALQAFLIILMNAEMRETSARPLKIENVNTSLVDRLWFGFEMT